MTPPNNRRRLPFAIGAAVVLIAGAIALSAAVNKAAGTTPIGAATPTPSATPAPATIPFADCSAATFGPALAPLNEPSTPTTYTAAPAMTINTGDLYEATITTSEGNIVLCLQPALAPLTVNNFVTLARNHFFDGVPFWRIGPNSSTPDVIQGGDPDCIGNIGAAPATPTGSCGSGGPGYSFKDEQVHEQYVAGVIAMANSGIGTGSNGSQFFIIKSNETSIWPLNNKGLAYNLFGKVVDSASLAVVGKIAQGDVMETVTVSEQT